MNITYFPNEGDYKVFTDEFKLIAEGFSSKAEAAEYVAKNTDEELYDIFVVWNRESNWSHYGVYLGTEGLEEHKKKILYQGDGARVKKVKSVLRNGDNR